LAGGVNVTVTNVGDMILARFPGTVILVELNRTEAYEEVIGGVA